MKYMPKDIPTIHLHVGPKRTASTLLQNLMVKFLPSDLLDRTAHEGNSRLIALCMAMMHGASTESVTNEIREIDVRILMKGICEVKRLAARMKSGGSVIMSCELFSEIGPDAVEESLKIESDVGKFVHLIYRKTAPLLASLFSNDIVGGYRGTVEDFIKDVLSGGVNNFDLFPIIDKWEARGWKVIIIPFNEGSADEMVKNILEDWLARSRSTCNIDVESKPRVEVINKSLSPDILFRISQFSNAMREYPPAILSNLGAIGYINKILVPFLRDSPYSPRDFNPVASPLWQDFVASIDNSRNEHYASYLAFQ